MRIFSVFIYTLKFKPELYWTLTTGQMNGLHLIIIYPCNSDDLPFQTPTLVFTFSPFLFLTPISHNPSHENIFVTFFKFIFLSNLYTQGEAQTRNHKIKSRMLFQRSQPATLIFVTFKSPFILNGFCMLITNNIYFVAYDEVVVSVWISKF